MDLEAVRDNLLFQGMTEAELSACVSALSAREKQYPRGSLILRAGETTDCMGIVLTGSVTIESNDAWGGCTVLSHVGQGGFFAETYALLEKYRPRGIVHCYSGSAEMAAELLKLGWYLGFDGPITYKNARKSLEVLELCPLERILIETDSPYLSPVPMRGRRNDSGNLPYIVDKIAEVKSLDHEAVAAATLANGRRLFGIGEEN